MIDMKWILLGVLAYTLFTKKKGEVAAPSAVKPPTAEELQAKALEAAKKAQETAESILSSV
jgi:hypothetical protein